MELAVLQEADGSRPRVSGAVYPRRSYEGRPWTQWGQGVVADGRFWSAIGDHRGPDGNSYVFAYDPESGRLVEVADVLGTVPHRPGEWGYGKIHAQMVLGPCDRIWFATYWGTRDGLEYTDTYRGDRLLVLDPRRAEIVDLGVPAPGRGIPSLAGRGNLLYLEAADPAREVGGDFVVYDVARRKVIFTREDERHAGFRSIAVGSDGRAFYSLGDGRLAVYDPRRNEVVGTVAGLPGDVLRAAAPPLADGTILGVTRDPAVFFAMTPEGVVRTLGTAAGYTTSVGVSPDGGTLYSMPLAHGGAYRIGAPLVAVDTADGTRRTVVELEGLVEDALGLELGGSYDVVVDPSGTRVYVGANAGPIGAEAGFGEVVLLVVDLP